MAKLFFPQSFPLFLTKMRKIPLVGERFETALKLIEWGEYESALLMLREVLHDAPHSVPLHFHIAEACRFLGKNEEAANFYQICLALDTKDRLGAQIKLALMGLRPRPACLPPAYIQGLFDQYAESFDQCLVENLGYHVPEESFRTVRANQTQPIEKILDLGCGTGLSAAPFQGMAQFIEGVDLSEGMLAKAQTKNIYHNLQKGDIQDYLQSCRKIYDLIICLDVLIYKGDTERFFSLVKDRLSGNGLFVFSIQSAKEGDFTLGQDHRYTHSIIYIEHCLRKAGLVIVSITDITLRQEQGAPVAGQIILCRQQGDTP